MSTSPNVPILPATSPEENVVDAPGAATHSANRHAAAKLPPDLAAAARGHARRMSRRFEHLFLADPKLKESYAAAIRKDLPLRPRPPGQPAQEIITKAEKLSRRFVARPRGQAKTALGARVRRALPRLAAADSPSRAPGSESAREPGPIPPKRSTPETSAPPRCKTITAELFFGK
jgi:hypothetical protein